MRNILVLNFFPAFYPPSSGGELRYYNLYRELSRFYDITLLSPTYSHHQFEIIEHSSTFREYRVPKESIHDELHMQLDREDVGKEVSALVCALSTKHPNNYHLYYSKLYPKADIIIHEFPYMLEYDLFFGLDQKPRIYNSHNYESFLVNQIWNGSGANPYKEYIYELEKRLVEKSNLIFATSEEEKNSFITDYKVNPDKIKLAPNGIHPEEWSNSPRSNLKEGSIKAFFIGSAHPPNIEAVDFIINEVARQCPTIEFEIAGSCCSPFEQGAIPQNVKLLGRIDDKQKNELFAIADISINPMFSGAGTNLKTLEYFSSGIPLFSTDIGVRGIAVENEVHYIKADRSNFARKLNEFTYDFSKLNEIAERGRAYINEFFAWKSIANSIYNELEKLQVASIRETILLLNDFPVSNPVSGGEVRIYNLYKCLSEYFTVVMLCFSNDDNLVKNSITDHFVEICIPKTKEHIEEEIRVNKQFWVSATDIINSYMCSKNMLLSNLVKSFSNNADLCIVCHPYMGQLLHEVEKDIPIIYESLNAEYVLKKSSLLGHPQYENLIQTTIDIETLVCKKSKFIITVSDEDQEYLKQLLEKNHREMLTVRNGVSIVEYNNNNIQKLKTMFSSYPVIVFVGSAHLPNIESMQFIIENLATQIEAYFVVIGSVCDAFAGQVPDNVLLFGKLDEAYKQALMGMSDIAINPMISGSGSNLKLADYFAHKIPTITTKFGARGYDIENETHCIICDSSEFKDNILKLLSNEELKNSLVQNAYQYVLEELEWSVIAEKFRRIIKTKSSNNSPRKKLLVLTYRFTEPPLGGAETFMLNILKEVDKIGEYSIDVITTEIEDIYNKYHFSCDYTFEKKPVNLRGTNAINVSKFPITLISDNKKYIYSQSLYDSWIKESVNQSLNYLDKYIEPILLGGWYYPEKAGERYEIWSSGKSLIYVKGAKFVKIEGYNPKRRKLVVKTGERELYKNTVSGHFNLEISILPEDSVIELSVETFSEPNLDPRALGIRVLSISYCNGQDEDIPVRMDYDYKSFMKEYYYEAYIEGLIDTAEQRPSELDDIFQTIRGPKSEAMESWLKSNIQEYDIILGHSIPFNTLVIASEYANRYQKPVVLIPHFHMDDEFYHWKSYYDAMRKASGVIAAPKASIPYFYDKIGVNSHNLSGGAIYKQEYNNVDVHSFRKRYGSDLPFILVLGRKSAAKNYRIVVEAVKELNRNGKVCNLVLIGRDEDGEAIDSKDAIYMGELSREEVLAALKECACLVSMSESESFGIVILEAWMQKRPVVVSSNCAAFVELVEDGINGLLADKNTLKNQIEYLLQNTEEGRRMGGNGFEKVSTQYTWEALGQEINIILNRYVNSPYFKE